VYRVSVSRTDADDDDVMKGEIIAGLMFACHKPVIKQDWFGFASKTPN
jgi:hypothetical protein